MQKKFADILQFQKNAFFLLFALRMGFWRGFLAIYPSFFASERLSRLLFDESVVEHVPSDRNTATHATRLRTIVTQVGAHDKCGEASYERQLFDV